MVALSCLFAIGKKENIKLTLSTLDKFRNIYYLSLPLMMSNYRRVWNRHRYKDSLDKYSLSLTRFPGSVFTEYRYERIIIIRIVSWGIYSFNHILSVIIHLFMWLSARRAFELSGNHECNYQCSCFPDYVFLCVNVVLHHLLFVRHTIYFLF